MKLLVNILKINKLPIALLAVLLSSITLAAIKTDTASFVDTSAYTSDFTSIPPFLETATGKPSVIMAFDVSGSMLVPAYPQSGTNWSNGVMNNFDPDKSYYGYFEDELKYTYDYTNEFFIESSTGEWDGGFLNWLTMRRVDVARKVMIGGKVADRDGTVVGSDTYYVLEGEREVRTSDDFQKSYSLSSAVSPIPDDAVITIADGRIDAPSASMGDTDTSTVISDKLEMGTLHRAWSQSEYLDEGVWPTVNFRNTYTDPVFVVATLSYNGSDESLARGYNVTSTSAQVGLIEYDNANGHGAADNLFYMVAERGCHDIEMADGTEIDFCADNSLDFDKNDTAYYTSYSAATTPPIASPFSSAPAVFAGEILNSDERFAAQTRVYNVDSLGFNLMFTDTSTAGFSTLFNDNYFHWIAIEKESGTTALGSLIQIMDVGSTDEDPLEFDYPIEFEDTPFVMATTQTIDNYVRGEPYSVRIGDRSAGNGATGGDGWDEEGLTIALQRHDSSNLGDEEVVVMAVRGQSAKLRIRLALDEEPQGLVQENDSAINFGLTVYNFDHKTNSLSNIVTGNKVHAGTMHPCYPIFDDTERWNDRVAKAATDPYSYVYEETLYNGSKRDYICVPTPVHAPNENIVQVIEDYPMIWGSTPIAESMVDVGRYVRQDNTVKYTSAGGSSSNQRAYGNDPAPVVGVDGTSSAGSYLWDPYYDTVQEQRLDCKKVFALNFNDGAPYRDYDGSSSDHYQPNGSNTHPYIYDIANDSHGENEALDNVALALRANDCRTADPDLGSHQEVISYFVYAALGADEQSNTSTRRMREAAARGGFVDDNGDHLPDPMHPTDSDGNRIDFNAYAALNSTPGESNPEDCPTTEWDNNNDCEPDTFFLALDGAEIKDKLQSALTDILARVASGGAASVVSTTSSGDGAVFQSSFVPSESLGDETVRWYGDVSALMIDSDGYLRNDGDADQTLDEFSTDQIVDSCYDKNNKVVRMKLSTDPDSRPTAQQFIDCQESVFPVDPIKDSGNDVNPLWSASESLSALTNTQAATQRGSYGSSALNRYILTALPDNTGTLAMQDFVPGTFTSDLVGLLDTSNTTEATTLINFIRGVDDNTLRNRTFNKGEATEETKRLGDIIYSTPVAVGRPSERLNLLYDDTTYNEFFKRYRNRRTMLYFGANDGMLHAFNGGWYNRTDKEFVGTLSGFNDWDLGQEVWSYVPFNLLPHLKYIAQPDYGVKDGDHSYFVDQTPYVFDARIFDSSGVNGPVGQPDTTDSDGNNVETHPNGWGTVLVVGFRSGGGEVDVYPDPSDLSVTQTVRPAYLIFDITDPEQKPVLLAEFTHEKLGMSMSTPTALTMVQTGANPETDWFLIFGSGPSSTANGNDQMVSEQNAHLFLYNLKTLSLQAGGFGTNGVWDLGATNAANSFVGDFAAADWDLDVSTDAVYFGTAQGLDTADTNGNPWPDANGDGIPDSSDGLYEEWSGKLFRLRTDPGGSASAHQWAVDVMYDAGQPIVNRPGLSFDKNKNRWVHVGTGRFFTVDDAVDNTDGVLVGLKEPRHSTNRSAFAIDTTAISTAVSALSGNIVDTSSAEVTEETGALNGSVSTPFALSSDTVEALEEAQMAYSDATNYLNGWVKNLDAPGYRGARAMGSPAVLGGFVSQTVYAPDQQSCSVTGESSLYALRYTTGTAWKNHVFEDPDDTVNNDEVLETARLGETPSLSPGIHLGENRKDGEATLINLNSDLSITTTTESNLEGIFSKETSWREL